jgi:hypothetical protein
LKWRLVGVDGVIWRFGFMFGSFKWPFQFFGIYALLPSNGKVLRCEGSLSKRWRR